MSRLVVSIVHVEFTGDSQVLYVIKVQQDIDEWEVHRTYSDFRKLRDDVHHVMKDTHAYMRDDTCSRDFTREIQNMKFPAKRLFGSKKDHVVKERAEELHRFLIKLLFLTHTYRKAQKTRYDQYKQGLPDYEQTSVATLQNRTQASVIVFYLLRDFLKPAGVKTDMSSQSGDLLSSSGHGIISEAADGKNGKSSNRLIRESKILAMTSFNTSELKNLMSREGKKMRQHKHRDLQVEELRKDQHKYQHEQRQSPMVLSKELKNEATNSANDNCGSTRRKECDIRRNTSKTMMETSGHSRSEDSTLCEPHMHKHQFLVNEHRKQRNYSTPDGNAADWKHRSARASPSVSTSSAVGLSPREDSLTEMEKMSASSSVPSSASSATSADEVKLLDLSSMSQCKRKKSSRGDSNKIHSSEKTWSKESTLTARSKEQKSSSRTKRKGLPAKNMLMSESETMSRVSSVLNAQAISIDAQRELERYLSEYSAIMILRYVDRFVNKAVMKAPGCYHVNAQDWLVIDGKRFLEELELTFTDLPNNFGELFHIGALGDHDEWGLPLALNKYVQLKWESFQTMISNSVSPDHGHSSAADLTSDSDDSDSDYDYEEVGGGGYMKANQTFSNDEESMLQEMIANGTAGREQMLRLRRHMNEQGWNRRENPGSRSQRLIEETSDTDKEDTIAQRREKRSSKRYDPKRVSCDVEKYQQEQNSRRKDRLSRVQSIGGFV
ncbi:hypothetical protein KXD40_002975 [Peronospora effusa]|uniref:PX domain-containing protein n=1 Tax=Peronospora effusa TaxID=542832 RepID=A0A3M6VAG0_9STRA|nr:hypothetical protein DD238_007173 [Peronospora effusa]RQM09984.1 hypothetical protein DD237_007439 [Peronospora effusa]UIZ29605.1 hypothetical protein KXD40_002975 [Peronospora effusa]CAI5701791.1 unnamed protein product [Peronospora effusa]